ncbi:MAG: MTH938/NDUFAF3 family protein [Lysobacteraceae bacterium]
MALVEHRSEGHHIVRRTAADAVTVDDRVFTASFVLAPDRCETEFAPHRIEELDEAAIQIILSLSPELVLLGTGLRQHFAKPAQMAQFWKRNIGIEAMDTAAAARTFNLLAAEGRRVVAVFLIGD